MGRSQSKPRAGISDERYHRALGMTKGACGNELSPSTYFAKEQRPSASAHPLCRSRLRVRHTLGIAVDDPVFRDRRVTAHKRLFVLQGRCVDSRLSLPRKLRCFRRAKGDNDGLRTMTRHASTSQHQHDNHYRSAGLYRERFAEMLWHQMPTTAMLEAGRELRDFPASFQVECHDWFSAEHPARTRLLADRQPGRGQFLPVQLAVALPP